MAHVRKTIRDAVVTALTGIGAGTVKATRKFPTNTSELPRVHVYTLSESINEDQSALNSHTRVMQLVVENIATGAETSLDDTLDANAALIEPVLNGNTFSGAALDTQLASTEIDVDSTGDVPVGGMRLTFNVTYRTIRGAPETAV